MKGGAVSRQNVLNDSNAYPDRDILMSKGYWPLPMLLVGLIRQADTLITA